MVHLGLMLRRVEVLTEPVGCSKALLAEVAEPGLAVVVVGVVAYCPFRVAVAEVDVEVGEDAVWVGFADRAEE